MARVEPIPTTAPFPGPVPAPNPPTWLVWRLQDRAAEFARQQEPVRFDEHLKAVNRALDQARRANPAAARRLDLYA